MNPEHRARRVALVWAQSAGGVIGRGNAIPWRIPEDTAHFKAVTTGHPVIMGRRTWESLPPRFRPLRGRRNIVVTRQRDWAADGAEATESIEAALTLAPTEDVCVIGGSQIYAAAMPFATHLIVTEVDLEVDGDTFAPPIGPRWSADDTGEWLTSEERGVRYRFVTYVPGLPPR